MQDIIWRNSFVFPPQNRTLNFVKLHDEESNIGFIIESRLIEGASTDEVFIKGILSSTGKILKIEEIVGANADELVGKQWDELTNLLMK